MKRTVNDIWLRVVGISFLMALLLLSDDTYDQPITGTVLVLLLIELSTIIGTWHLNRAIILYCRLVLPSQFCRVYRILIMFGICVVASTILAWVMAVPKFAVIHKSLAGFPSGVDTVSLTINHVKLGLNGYGFDWFRGIINALFYNLVYGALLAVQDLFVYRKRLEQSEQEKEQLRIANLQSQLDVLKQQVNPHFLFNSLNTLSSLISEDAQQAEQFVDKLSGVYRYVLRANEQHLTTLEAELQFIDAYYHLLQTRYGNGLSLTVNVDERYHPCQLPPLTLQLLVENAVKHNVVSPKRPLRILITVDEQRRLVVGNTLQRKTTRVLSNGVGLSNIVAKYQMLNLAPPSVDKSAEQFTVRLPLLMCSSGNL